MDILTCMHMGQLLQDGKFSQTLNKKPPQCWLYCDPMFSDMEDPQVSLVQSWVGDVGYYKFTIIIIHFRWFLGPYFWILYWKVQKSKKLFSKNRSSLIANCPTLRPPTEMIQYSIETPCPEDFKKYKTISVGGLGAEQFTIQINLFSTDFQIWVNTLWKGLALGHPQKFNNSKWGVKSPPPPCPSK